MFLCKDAMLKLNRSKNHKVKVDITFKYKDENLTVVAITATKKVPINMFYRCV